MALGSFVIDPCLLALPGAGKIEYVPIDEIDTSVYEEILTEATYNQQAFVGVATWYRLPYAAETGDFAEEQNSPDQGSFFRQRVSAFLPSDSTAVRGLLHRMRNRRFLLRISRSGLVLLLGTPERGLSFSSNFESGTSGSDNRGHRVTFTGVSLIKSPGFVPVF